jgi:FeS assembly protein IscX
MKLSWKDTDEVAWALLDAHPDIDPLKLSFTKLRQMILEIPDFAGEPEGCNEAVLENIQMTWREERQ